MDNNFHHFDCLNLDVIIVNVFKTVENNTLNFTIRQAKTKLSLTFSINILINEDKHQVFINTDNGTFNSQILNNLHGFSKNESNILKNIEEEGELKLIGLKDYNKFKLVVNYSVNGPILTYDMNREINNQDNDISVNNKNSINIIKDEIKKCRTDIINLNKQIEDISLQNINLKDILQEQNHMINKISMHISDIYYNHLNINNNINNNNSYLENEYSKPRPTYISHKSYEPEKAISKLKKSIDEYNNNIKEYFKSNSNNKSNISRNDLMDKSHYSYGNGSISIIKKEKVNTKNKQLNNNVNNNKKIKFTSDVSIDSKLNLHNKFNESIAFDSSTNNIEIKGNSPLLNKNDKLKLFNLKKKDYMFGNYKIKALEKFNKNFIAFSNGTNIDIYNTIALLKSDDDNDNNNNSNLITFGFKNNDDQFSLKGCDKKITALLSFNSKHLISGDEYGKILIWNLITKNIEKIIEHSKKEITSLITINSIYFASSSKDNSINVINQSDGTLLFKLLGHTAPVNKIILIENNKLLSISYDSTAKLWNLNSNVEMFTFNFNKKANCLCKLEDNLAALGFDDGSIEIVSYSLFNVLYNLTFVFDKDKCNDIVSATISNIIYFKDYILGSVSFDYSLRLWNYSTRTCLKSYNAGYAIDNIISIEDNQLVTCGGHENSKVSIWTS